MNRLPNTLLTILCAVAVLAAFVVPVEDHGHSAVVALSTR